MIPAALPVVLLANPGGTVSEKPKRKQTPKQRAASLKNLRKARAAKSPAPKRNPKKPKRSARKKDKHMAQSAKQRAASLKNLRKARARRKRGNPSHKRSAARAPATKHRRRRNSGGTTSVRRGVAFMEVASGVVVGGLAAGGIDYWIGGTEMFATPGKRALLHGGVALVTGVGGALAMPKAMGFWGGVGGSFAGLAAANALKWAWAGTAATPTPVPGTSSAGTFPDGTNPGMGAVVPSPRYGAVVPHPALGAGGIRPNMGAVVMDARALRGLIVNRGPRPTAR